MRRHLISASLPAVSPLESLAARAQEAFGFTPPPQLLQQWLAPFPRLDRLDAGLALACGLFHQQPEALACFERLVAPVVAAALSRAGAPPEEADEVLQKTRTLLFVEQGGERLTQYQGQGTFTAFVTTVALRLFTRTRKRDARAPRADDALTTLPVALDLERQLSRHQHRQHFTEAFRGALDALSPRERLLLQLNLVKGVSIDELAPMYRISRATAARWLVRARQALRDETLRRLAVTTSLEGDELGGLLASLESGFDLSLRRFLLEHSADATP